MTDDPGIHYGEGETMTKILRITAMAVVPALACLFTVSLPQVAHAEDKAQFTGHWNFNKTQSDDASQKVQDAQQASKTNQGNAGSGGGYPGGGGGSTGTGGGYPGGGGVYPGGMGGMGGMGGIWGGGGGHRSRTANRTDAVSSEEWDRLAENPKYLRIDQRSDQFVVIDDADHSQTFYPDDKKHNDKDADGNKISTKSSWEGGAFVAETRLPHSEKLTQTFRMSDDGKQMYVTTMFEAPSMSGPLSIRRVYDVAKTAAK